MHWLHLSGRRLAQLCRIWYLVWDVVLRGGNAAGADEAAQRHAEEPTKAEQRSEGERHERERDRRGRSG